MRFFTMSWWCGNQHLERTDPVAAYMVHLAAIKHRLPPDLLATQEEVSLHDTRLRHLRFDSSSGLLIIELESYSGDERLGLIYEDVESFESLADPAVGLLGPAGYGDLGYCEVDVQTDGVYEHRMLFSTGIELMVVFRRFRLKRNKPS